MDGAVIILLVGPKGAGKSYLAKRLERDYGVTFVRVEPIWMALADEIPPGTSAFDREGQARVLVAVREKLSERGAVALESTGTAPWFGEQLRDLKRIAQVMPVRIRARPATCPERVRTRDASDHIAVSEDRIAVINSVAAAVELPWSLDVRNETTARSQCLGGIIWSIGAALTEALHFDPRDGHLANPDLAEYHVPVHRDVRQAEVILLEERDPLASAIQAKGIGELGMCGGAGAIANAIYNACGARLRQLPMTPDRILAALPE